VNVHLADSTEASAALEHILRDRGHAVSRSDQMPLEADLYFFAGGHEMMKGLDRGLVVLDLRSGVGLESAAWVSYADLCLVCDESSRTILAETSGCEPERIFVTPDDETLLAFVDQAVRDELGPATIQKGGESVPNEMPAPHSQQIATLATRLEAINRQADVMLRGYQVRSRLPFVAWVRRNLTSHLREPYLDPILERQVRLNRELLALLREMVSIQADLEARLARLEEEHGHD
jgi:hypothetical protein